MSCTNHKSTCRYKCSLILTTILLISPILLFGCKDKTGDISKKLRLRIELEPSKSEYLLDDVIAIRIYIENKAGEDVVVCMWPTTAINIFTYYGNEKEVYEDKISFKSPSSKEDNFITVPAGKEIYYGEAEFAKKHGTRYFDKIGQWEFKIIQYNNYTGEEFGLKGWTGKLVSNTLAINISL